MIKGLRAFLLNVFLKLIFLKNVYVYRNNKSTIVIYLVIPFKNKLILLEKEKQYEIANLEVDVSKKQSILEYVRDLISQSMFSDISAIKDIELIDSFREFKRVKSGKQVKDNLFFRIDLSEKFSLDSLIGEAKVVDLEELKVECFKNRFNLYDYRLLIRVILGQISIQEDR